MVVNVITPRLNTCEMYIYNVSIDSLVSMYDGAEHALYVTFKFDDDEPFEFELKEFLLISKQKEKYRMEPEKWVLGFSFINKSGTESFGRFDGCVINRKENMYLLHVNEVVFLNVKSLEEAISTIFDT